MHALVFGEVLWDVFPQEKYIGGAPLNFAAHLVRCGGTAALVSAVGKDELGALTRERIQALGINSHHVASVDKDTGKCLVTLDQNATPSYDLLTDVAYDQIPVPQLGAEQFDVLYFGTLALRSDYNRRALEQLLAERRFADVFVDINIRPPFDFADSILFALRTATILKISDEELPAVLRAAFGEAFDEDLAQTAERLCLRFSNIKLLLITRGERGSFAYCAETKHCEFCSAASCKVVSAVGAGDSFSAAFLSQYGSGVDLPTALSRASRVSAFVVSHPGAVPDYDVKTLF